MLWFLIALLCIAFAWLILAPRAEGERKPPPPVQLVLGGAAPLLAVGLYMILGAPDYEGRQNAAMAAMAERASQMGVPPGEMPDINEMIARVEARLAENPDDLAGWSILGRSYLQLGRTEDAVTAFRRAVEIAPDNAGLHASLGQSLLMSAGGGELPAEAREAFQAALRLDPEHRNARFFLAEITLREGDREGALAAWRALVEGLPEDDVWRQIVETRIRQAETAATEQ